MNQGMILKSIGELIMPKKAEFVKDDEKITFRPTKKMRSNIEKLIGKDGNLSEFIRNAVEKKLGGGES